MVSVPMCICREHHARVSPTVPFIGPCAHEKVEILRAEVERLRAALVRIQALAIGELDGPIREAARAALGTDK
jgi:hypothetical protein